MSEAQTLSYTKAEAASRLRAYRVLFIVSIAVNTLVGLYGLLCPVGLARLLVLPDPFPDAWVRLWAATLLGLQLVYVPGARNPVFYRWPNWSSIAIKLLMAIVLLCVGSTFRWLALWEFAWFVALFATYYRLAMADLARNP
jgi:hypothetical protein